MVKENNIECPNCGEKTIIKPRVYYGIFRNKRQPDGICQNCGAFYWEHPQKPIPSIIFKSPEQKKEQEPKKKHWFEIFLKQEKKKGERRRGRNGRVSPAEKSRK
jgi:ribosomal protein S27AE